MAILVVSSLSQAYYMLDEILITGELQESSKKAVLRVITQQDSLAEGEDITLEKS